MLVDIFMDIEPENKVRVTVSKEVLKALAIKRAGIAALASLTNLPVEEQRAKVPQMQIDIFNEEARLENVVWLDSEIKEYTTVEACIQCTRPDGKGIFFHCLADSEDIPEGAYDFKSAPDYMKKDGEWVHTFGSVHHELPIE